MYLTSPGSTDVDRGNREVRELRDRIQSLLPNSDVQVTKFLKDFEYVEKMVVESGTLENQNVQQDFVAEITIKGRGT